MKVKRIIAATLSICMLGGAVGYDAPLFEGASVTANAAKQKYENVVSGVCGENVTWTLDRNTGVLTIDGTGDNYFAAFVEYKDEIKKIFFSGGITSIPNGFCAHCSSLTEVYIPEGVTMIGKSPFVKCPIKEIWIPSTCTTIADYAIPDDITIYGYKGSAAEEYAEKSFTVFVDIDSAFNKGDLNNDTMIDGRDATLVLSMYADSSSSGYVPTAAERIVGNVNNDNFIDGRDATIILGYYADLSAGASISFENYLKSMNYV